MSADGAPIEWLVDEPILNEPVLIVMLTGWIDAAGAAEAAADALSAGCESSPIARFDDDTFIDFRARRPTMEVREGLNSNLRWSTIEFRAGRSPGGRDVLFLLGPEPDMAWNRFAATVTDVVVEVGVTHMIGMGAYPFATPHTRPSRLACTTPSADVLATVPHQRASVDVPAGIAALLEHSLHGRKIPAMTLWAQVPHYLSTMGYPAASLALLEGVAQATGISIDTTTLHNESTIQHRRIEGMIADNAEHRAMLQQLEELYDAADEADAAAAGDAGPGGPGGPTDPSALELRSGDELAAEIQRFLRDQD